MEACASEAVRYVWEGAIPLQIHLHESEVTTLPPPPPALILGPRIGYLPLLIPLIKPYFDSALPPGVDTVWFEYKGLPLKWYIPTGVLFDLLCIEPERPWNLTVHFRGYPDILTPCEGEDSVKWSFINSLKEAAYIINGNCKNVMNMSQADQLELWQSIIKGNCESYFRASSKLKLGPLTRDCLLNRTLSQAKNANETTTNQTGKIPVRLYVRHAGEDLDDLEDATPVDNWDSISYLNRPVEINKEEGINFLLRTAIESLLPDFFDEVASVKEQAIGTEDTISAVPSVEVSEASSIKSDSGPQLNAESISELPQKPQIKLIRIQGIEPGLDVPLYWIINNLVNPDHFLHVCVVVSTLNTGR